MLSAKAVPGFPQLWEAYLLQIKSKNATVQHHLALAKPIHIKQRQSYLEARVQRAETVYSLSLLG